MAWCNTSDAGDTLWIMPTKRPRHLVTETDELAAALDRASSVWPGLSRPQLLQQLALQGAAATFDIQHHRVQVRLDALREHSGVLRGVYGPDYLARLREDWPA